MQNILDKLWKIVPIFQMWKGKLFTCLVILLLLLYLVTLQTNSLSKMQSIDAHQIITVSTRFMLHQKHSLLDHTV